MQVEFHGEPLEIQGSSTVTIEARANGQPLVCLISEDALHEATRTLRIGVSRPSVVFRQFRHRYLRALTSKLSTLLQVPSEALITASDVRQADR